MDVFAPKIVLDSCYLWKESRWKVSPRVRICLFLWLAATNCGLKILRNSLIQRCHTSAPKSEFNITVGEKERPFCVGV